MTKKNILKFEKRLLEEKMQILRQRGYTGAILLQPEEAGNIEESGSPPDASDQGYDTYQRELASKLTSEQTRTLKEIEEALRRVETRTYGICENCGKAIPQARLEMVPHTRYCVKCIRKLEHPEPPPAEPVQRKRRGRRRKTE
jgi:RNA polymerase-binding transcription factor DksA